MVIAGIILKRALHKTMTESDLLSIAGSIIASPPIPPELHETLVNNRQRKSDNLLDVWREEVKLLLHNVAAEKSWTLQRQHLLQMAVAANSWIALYKGVDDEARVSLWKSYVEGIGEFAANPAETWPWLLKKTRIFAALNDAVCAVVGQACYGTTGEQEHLKFYREIRSYLIEKGIGLDAGIYDLDATHPALAELMMETRNRIYYPAAMEGFQYLRAVGDRIAAGSFDPADALERWPKIAERVNAALARMQAEVTSAYVERTRY